MRRVDQAELDLLRSPGGPAPARGGPRRRSTPATTLLALATALRRDGSDPALVAAALTQARLRVRARAKFGADADRMYLTAAGLEQATRAVVAEHRAARFAAAGAAGVADLCCGIGGDLIALARAGLQVLGRRLATRSPSRSPAPTSRRWASPGWPTVRVRRRHDASTSAEASTRLFVDPARRTSAGGARFDPDGVRAAVLVRRRAGRPGARHGAEGRARHPARPGARRRRGRVGLRRRRREGGRAVVRPAGRPPRPPPRDDLER